MNKKPFNKMNIAVIGSGAWGSALASSLSPYHHMTLYGRDPVLLSSMAQTGYNSTYLSGIRLHASLSYCDNFDKILASHSSHDDILILATPLSAMRDMCLKIAASNTQAKVLWLCKGVERETKAFPHQIASEILPDTAFGALSGPSFAQEVAQGFPCALVLASAHPDIDTQFAQLLHHKTLRIYHSNDMIGVEIGGAVKNILAIAAGICDGLQFGLNARAALLTRGMAEMLRLGQALGAKSATLSGLTGMGDLILTATGGLSRNRTVGLELANGQPLQKITANLGHVAEGVLCAHAIDALATELHVEMPITQAVCAILDGQSPLEAAKNLMLRDPTNEH